MPINLDRNTGLVSEGTHLFKITRAEEKLNNDGEPKFIVEFTCQDSGPDQGLKFTEFFSIDGRARYRLDNFLDALNAPKKGSWGASDVMGKLIRITIAHNEWQGNVRAQGQAFHDAKSTVNPEVRKNPTSTGATLPKSDKDKEIPF